jgi:hypothetical protein
MIKRLHDVLIMLGKRSLKLLKLCQLILEVCYLNKVLKKVLLLLTRHTLCAKHGWATHAFNGLLLGLLNRDLADSISYRLTSHRSVLNNLAIALQTLGHLPV